MTIKTLAWAHPALSFDGTTKIMGILNVTPDSFSDGGKFYAIEDAVKHAEKMIADGADIIDIGGESSRPFAEPVRVTEEIDRVVPVIEALQKKSSVPISIDTIKAEVAQKALEAGASIVNDISALRFDPQMASLVADREVPVILMHMLGTPATMQVAPQYDNVVKEIHAFLTETIELAVKKGIPQKHIIIDPGIGFGKTILHNLMILKELKQFLTLNVPVLIGASRKSFIQKLLTESFTSQIDVSSWEVENGTQATVSISALNGAHIVRVHDVKSTNATLKIVNAVIRSRNRADNKEEIE